MKFLRLALLTAAVSPAAAGAATPGATPVAEATPADPRVAALTRENQQLAADLARAQTAMREAQAALTKQSAEIATVRAEAAATRIQLTRAQAEVASARTSLVNQGAAAQFTPDLSGALERERTAHIATKAILTQREAQVQDLLSSRTKIESENRVLKASKEVAKSTPGSEAKKTLAQNAELNARVAALTRDLMSSRSEVTTVRQELRNQTNKTLADADARLRQVATLQEDLALARKELSQAKTSLDATAQSTAAASAARAQSEAQLAALRTQIATLERDLQTATTNVRQLTADQARFESALREATEARQQLAAVATQSNAAKSEIEAQVTRLQREAQASTATSQKEIIRLRDALAKSETTPKMSPADLAAMQIQERQLAALEQELSTTRSQLSQTKAALDAAAQSAAASIASKSEAETQLVKLRAEVAALQADLVAAAAAAQKQNAAFEAENARLQGVLARSNLSAAAPMAELEAAQRSAAEAQRRLTAAREEIDSLRAQVAAAQHLEKRVRQLEAEKAAAEKSTPATVEPGELARLTAARAAAEDKLATALRAYTLLARERDDLRAQVAALSTQEAPKAEIATVANPAPVAVTFDDTPVAVPTPDPLPGQTTPAARPVAKTQTLTTYPVRPAPPPRPAFQATRPVVPPGRPAFSHRIAAGESLSSIARRYYGNAKRWPEIVAANRDVLPDQRSFSAGKMIRIP